MTALGPTLAEGLTVVEYSAFVAAPFAGMTLAQMGADVVRLDPIDGSLDQHRWPVSQAGISLFWAGLNKGKRSVRLDLRSAEGRELAAALVTCSGPGGGVFLTNLPTGQELSYPSLRDQRDDVICVFLEGYPDGTSAVDYTVQPTTGFPIVTGERGRPTNSVVPTWDLLLGSMAATAVLAADRSRARSGVGDQLRIALSDIALSTVAHLGRLGAAELGDTDQPADGNHLYGAFGRDFRTSDGRDVMIVGLTRRQWRALLAATGVGPTLAAAVEPLQLDLDSEGGRYLARYEIAAAMEEWVGSRTLAEVESAFADAEVAWAPYQSFRELAQNDARVRAGNGIFESVEHAGVGRLTAPRSPIRGMQHETVGAAPPPVPGEHTVEVLASRLALTDAEIGRLLARRIVGGTKEWPPEDSP